MDPLTQVVGLLRPGTFHSKVAEAAGAWRVARLEAGRPFYCAILHGTCRLAVRGGPPVTLEEGDFALIPSAFDFSMSSLVAVSSDNAVSVPVELRPGLVRLTSGEGPPDVRILIGYCTFESPDAALLVSLLPRLVHARGERRLTTLLQLVNDEVRADRPGRDVILERLVEVMLIEALRSAAGTGAPPGLLRGLADERVAPALRRMHEHPALQWTVAELARAAALSRSSFFDRFKKAVGIAPMEYLLHWRMALAKDFLLRRQGGVTEVARQVGYSSASTFSVAFARNVGLPPISYARIHRLAAKAYPDGPEPIRPDIR